LLATFLSTGFFQFAGAESLSDSTMPFVVLYSVISATFVKIPDALSKTSHSTVT
jgi:hypothetical protein